MKKFKLFLGCLLFAAAILFAAFVWPTAYKYETVPYLKTARIIRINRFTQNAATLGDQGWQPMETPPDQWDQLASTRK